MYYLLVLLFSSSISYQANLKRDTNDNINQFQIYPISLISDQDQETRVKSEKLWFSTLVGASLHISKNGTQAMVDFLDRKNYTSQWSFDGRGMEFSDLKMYNGQLLTVDDKTGIIYRIEKDKAVPWVVLTDGPGNTDKPYKGEWLAVKNNIIHCGGYGKEFTTHDGAFVDDSPFWIKQINEAGEIIHVNWKEKFIKLREQLEIYFPGYMIHESAQWSNIYQRWFFLPRHLSKVQYSKNNVHTTGANVLLSAAADFSNITYVYIGKANTTKGFSAFQFVPDSNDQLIVAVKTAENPGEPLNSYIMVFNTKGEILLDETEIPGNLKCEGVEFFDMQQFVYPYFHNRDGSSAEKFSSCFNSFAFLTFVLALLYL